MAEVLNIKLFKIQNIISITCGHLDLPDVRLFNEKVEGMNMKQNRVALAVMHLARLRKNSLALLRIQLNQLLI